MKNGFKKTDAGVLPKDWDVQKFKAVTELITCGIAATPKYVREAVGVPFLSSSNVKNGKILWNGFRYISKPLHERLYRNNPPLRGDVLYSRVGTIGEAATIDVDFEFSIYVSLTLIKGDSRLDNEFLKHLLNSPKYRNRANREVLMGGGVGNLNVNVVREFPIPVPPLEEQRAIAEALSDVDALIKALDALITKKRNIKQGTMQQLLTGKKRLPGFSGEWEDKQFGEVVSVRKQKYDARRSGDHSFCVELDNIEQKTGQRIGHSTATTDSSIKSIFAEGDVLFGKLRAYLRKYWRADRSGVCSTEIWPLVARVGQLRSEFLFQIVQTNQFIDAASEAYGTHMPRSDWKVVRELRLSLPKLGEQNALAAVLSDMDAEIVALEQKRDKTTLIKQGMMQDLLTGKTRLI